MADASHSTAPTINCEAGLSSLIRFLKYKDGLKPKFSWSGSKEQLGMFIKTVFKDLTFVSDVLKWDEDPKHKMFSCKLHRLTFKYYMTTWLKPSKSCSIYLYREILM